MKKIRIAAAAAAVLLSTTTASLADKPKKPDGFGVIGPDGPAAQVIKQEEMDRDTLAAFQTAVAKVTSMPNDAKLQARAQAMGLNVLNVLWEDTGRFGGSSVGPNISDVTLQVREPLPGGGPGGDSFKSHLLPVIRHPNFTDKTADVAADKLWVKVGNQYGSSQIVSVPLSEVLKHLKEYVTNPDSIGGTGDLSAPRDTHYLVSAQHVFVPIAKKGKVEFNPVIFNYQSYEKNPAVLTLLVTREGTSVAAIENSGGDAMYGSGQQLFFNNKGQKTTFTAERKSDVKARIDSGQATAADKGALEEGADMLLIVQVPLKVEHPMGGLGLSGYGAGGGGMGSGSLANEMAMPAPPMAEGERERSDVESAVLGHGKDAGPVTEGNKLKLERDPQFPVRVTVQFYKATSNGVVSDQDLKEAKAQIDKVYAKGDYVGSLVVPEGERHRPTDWHLGQTPKKK